MSPTVPPFARTAAAIVVALATGCGTASFDPDSWSKDDYLEWTSNPTTTVVGELVVRVATPPAEDDPRSSFRFERTDGSVLTPWFRRPVPLDDDDNVPTRFVISRTGVVAVFDDGSELLDDVGAPPPRGWYRLDRDGLHAMPFAELRALRDGTVLGVVAEWDEEPEIDDGSTRLYAVGYGRTAPAEVRSITLVSLGDDLVTRGEQYAVDPRAPEPWTTLGSLVRVPGGDGAQRYLDARLRPVEFRATADVGVDGLRALAALDRDHHFHLLQQNGADDVLDDRWDSLRAFSDLGRWAVALGRDGTTTFDLVMVSQGRPYVALPSVAAVERFEVDVPALLRGRPGFGATWQGLVAHRIVDGVDVWETFDLGHVAAGEGRAATGRDTGIANVQQWLAAQADAVQVGRDQRVARAHRPLDAANQLTDIYIEAIRDRDFGAAGLAVQGVKELIESVEIPADLPAAEDIRRRIALCYVTVVDWELRRPDRTLETLVAIMPSARDPSFAARFWPLLEQAILGRTPPPTRSVWEQLHRYASTSVSADAREKIRWWHDRLSEQETRVEYDRAMARGDYAYADSISSHLGEDGWIDHLLNAPVVAMRADLLEIAMQRRPELRTRLAARRRQQLDEELTAARARHAAEERAADAASAASAAAWQASAQRWDRIHDLVRKGVDVSGM